MVLYLGAETTRSDQYLDVDEVLGRLPEADRFKGREKWTYIAHLMSRMTGETAYVERYIKKVFENQTHFEIRDGYRDTSLVLNGIDGYGVRLNRWRPLGGRPIDVQTDIGLAYDVPHNHDFQLITKGIWGPGYQTDVYRFEYESSVGAHEEEVDLTYQGRFQLSTGAVIWFEEYSDVHIQRAPSELSLSFNLIPTRKSVGRGQLFIDVDTRRVKGFPETNYAQILSLLTLLCDLGISQDVYDVVFEIGSLTQNAWFKVAVASLIASRWDLSRDHVFELLGYDDKDGACSRYGNSAFSARHIS